MEEVQPTTNTTPVTISEAPKKKRGRPPGSKNKKSLDVAAPQPAAVGAAPLPPPVVQLDAPVVVPAVVEKPKGKRGRPPGSKNKPKEAVASVEPVLTKTETDWKAFKESIQPEIAPHLETASETKLANKVDVTPIKTAQVAVPVVEQQETVSYTIADLQSPKLASVVEQLGKLVKYASPVRLLDMETRQLPGLTINQYITKVVIDFLDVDLLAFLNSQNVK